MKIKIIVSCLMLTFLLGSCKKWIDVKPSDRLAEDQLFSTRDGYLSALNGVYVELTNAGIYGENMTMSSLDVMAQYYYMPLSTHRFADFTTFNYTSDNTKLVFDNIWKKAYELIVNCNVIIERCGENSNGLLPGAYFGIVKGEALALRAMLHFDMLRLFGPIYSQADKEKPCIPYNTSSRPESPALLGSAEIMQHVIDDLMAALALLKDADPVITDGVRYGASVNGINDFNFRQYRLNYYAVKALLGRAYLWKQDKENAGKEAKEVLAAVLNPAKPIFKIGLSNNGPSLPEFDHLFISEVMFSLYTISRQNIYTGFFAPDLDQGMRLSFNNNDDNPVRRNELYDDQNDHRLKAWMIQNNTSGSFLTHVKFGVTSKGPGANMMPLIRLSEVILIAAECSNTLSEATTWLNMLRTGRNCVSLSPATTAQLKDFITREFRKEVFGEGQMFFYYKRNAMTTVPNHAALTGTKTMSLNNYVVPLPVSEVANRYN
ncbi:RagB/SusD family nutrient uptake outer membrane protein [Niastella caeni]|uniref:RagB/SusD family nutrient uptake outer membrane protein n=1 Tax=Niastella caeni TaxID=2569763 RepID=A0A4S8HS50_9BACT|nr:RagB/SusD family nutrient uptake outer membrane protein [Niastella caeni]THU38358.1 RagB/SusD family nutrient uptake outer membrane protein [Niastella caeni]